jgi:hypothetical protein
MEAKDDDSAGSGGTDAAPAPRRTQAQRTAATRARLIAAGRRLFADHGFDAVTTEAIVEAAGVTRGALYHQFEGKAALFAAVNEEVEADLVAVIGRRIGEAGPPDAVAAMRLGSRLFLELCAAPEVQQIVIVDAPAVLGWQQWREVASNTASVSLKPCSAKPSPVATYPTNPCAPVPTSFSSHSTRQPCTYRAPQTPTKPAPRCTPSATD